MSGVFSSNYLGDFDDDEPEEPREIDPEMMARYEQVEELRRQLWEGPREEVIMDYGITMIPYNPYKKDYITIQAQNMRNGNYESFNIDAVRVGTVGSPLILFQKYPVEQIWFPFVNAVLADAPPTKEEREHSREEARRKELRKAEMELYGERSEWRERPSHGDLQERADGPMYIDRDHQQMYHFDMGDWVNDQFVLPYREYQKTENIHHYTTRCWDKLSEKDENRNRKLLTIDIKSLNQKDLVEWLSENTFGRFHINDRSDTLTMEKYHEWMHARLRFSGVSE
jgi:hypothetical protein